MSVCSEDLITLSPCAPKLTIRSSTTSPVQSTGTLDARLGASPQAVATAQLHHDFHSDMRNTSHNQEKIVYPDEQVPKAQYGNHVVISPLPPYIAKRDILCRVRGGKIISCILSKFGDSLVAVVAFEQQDCAQHYVDFCAESFNKGLWTFLSDPSSVPLSYMTASVKIYNDAPGLGVTWRHKDIPGIPKTYPSSTTRCLCLNVCPAERVVGIWGQLGLATSEHLRNQLDDMWLDRPEWNAAAGNNCGTLHIWYADIKSAMEAQRRCPGLKYEADPCSTMPYEAFILGPDKAKEGSDNSAEDVYIDHHSYPFVSLLDLHKGSVLVDVSRGVLDPYEAFWGIRAPQPVEENVRPLDLSERLLNVLRNHLKVKKDDTRRGTQTHTLRPPPGFAIPPYGRIEPHHGSHISNEPPSTDLNHAQAQPSNEGLTSQNPPAMGMSYGVEDPRSNSTDGVNLPRQGRLDFKMPRPRPGYTHQFPPPLGGEPRVVEYPSAVAEAMNQNSAGQGALARRTNRVVRQREGLQPAQQGASHCPAHCEYHATNLTDAQGGADTRAQARGTETCTSASSSADSLVPDPSSGPDHNNSTGSRSSSESPTTQTGPDYSRENWGGGDRPEDVYWTVDLDEFLAMDDYQWKAFGTSFYVPPPGFNSAERHVVSLD